MHDEKGITDALVVVERILFLAFNLVAGVVLMPFAVLYMLFLPEDAL